MPTSRSRRCRGRRRRREVIVPGHINNLLPPCPLSPHQMVHFDFPRADGRQIFSVHCCGERKLIVSPPCGSSRDRLAAVRSDSGPVIVVFVGQDGKYFTDYGSEGIHLRHIYRLMLEVLKQLEVDAQHRQQSDVAHTARLEELPINCTSSSYKLEVDAQPLQHSDVADTTRLEELSINATSSSYKQDTIWVRTEHEWALCFYTRIDHAESFHTYPDVLDGTFRNLEEVQKAIDEFLSDQLDPKMRMELGSVSQEGKCTLEMAIWRGLHWPDGTRKRRLKTKKIDDRRCWMLQLVKALVDKYNDDHNLLGDLAYKLRRLERYRYFHDAVSNGIYYHINFTTKTKEVDGFDCGLDNQLFFAELVQRGREELVVSCICRVDSSDARGCCYACSWDVLHPKADEYSGGLSESCRFRGMFSYSGPEEDMGYTPAELEAEETSVRLVYERQFEEGWSGV